MRRRRGLITAFWIFLLTALGFALQNIPGTYLIEEIDERIPVDSPAGQALEALERIEIHGTLYFEDAARHRISRNAEIDVPEDTWITLTGKMIPLRGGGEWILRPDELELVSDRPLLFIYREVTVARANHLRLNEAGRLEAIGHYQALSALWTGHRYQRQRLVRRDFKIPAMAGLDLSVVLSGLEPMVNGMLHETIPSSFDLGSVVELKIDRLHHFLFSENHLDLHVDGTLSSAQSRRVARVIQPSFRSRLGVDLHLPAGQFLHDAELGVSLRNVHTFNISGLNPIFDKLIRDQLRARRDRAHVLFSVREEYPDVLDWPGELFFDEFVLQGEEEDRAELRINARWLKHNRAVLPAE
jgi:hypothetical protein